MIKRDQSETYTAKVLIEQFDIAVNHFECEEFIIVRLHTTAKIQASISERRKPQP